MYIIASDNGARCRKTVPGTGRYAGSLVPVTFLFVLDGGEMGVEKVLFWELGQRILFLQLLWLFSLSNVKSSQKKCTHFSMNS
jgi:hypothetical protein